MVPGPSGVRYATVKCFNFGETCLVRRWASSPRCDPRLMLCGVSQTGRQGRRSLAGLALEGGEQLPGGRLVGTERDAAASAVEVGVLAVPLRRPLLDLAGPAVFLVTWRPSASRYRTTQGLSRLAMTRTPRKSWRLIPRLHQVAPPVAPTIYRD